MDSPKQLYSFIVGQQVSIPNPTPGIDSYLFTVVGSQLNIMIYFPELSDEEIRVFNGNRLMYGIHVIEDIPYILVQFLESDLCFCFPVNLFSMDPDHRIQALSTGIDKISLFLIDDDSQILRGIHDILFGIPAIERLNTALGKQSQKKWDREDINLAIKMVFLKYSNDQLLNMTTMFLPKQIV